MKEKEKRKLRTAARGRNDWPDQLQSLNRVPTGMIRQPLSTCADLGIFIQQHDVGDTKIICPLLKPKHKEFKIETKDIHNFLST